MATTTLRALDGLRVVELSIAIAGPSCARQLAFHGAEVLKIESKSNPDVVRLFGSAWARSPEWADIFTDTSPYIPEMMASKQAVGLDLKHPAGRDAARRLIATADVFITNYSTPAVVDLGMAEPDLREVNPDLIYLAMPAFGSDPELPYYEFISWGPNQAPLVGLDEMTGYPDQEPSGVAAFAPPDYFAGLHAVMAVLTALEQRDRTGEGSRIDLSQFDTTVAALGPYLMDHQLSGRVATRCGNRVPWAAPQGVYPCRGVDEWVAITVADDEQWRALVDVVADPELQQAELGSLAGRQAAHDRLDERLSAWTRTRSAEEAAARLAAAGVAVYPVNPPEGVLRDPQVADREWYVSRPAHRFPGGDLFGGSALRLTDTPGRWHRAGPSSGEHTVEVLTGLVGMSPDEVAALIADGAAHTPVVPDKTARRPYEPFLAALGWPTVHGEEAR